SRLEAARRDGVLDTVTTDLAAGLRRADLAILAVPVRTMVAMLDDVALPATPDLVVTDVGSTKAEIVSVAERLGRTRPLRFVGSHPMAGSEQSGYGHAREDLFRGATVIVTPTEASDPAAVKTVTAWWESLGAARVVALDPDT